MAHHIYFSDSFVLGRYTASEWDSRVVLFTQELGLVTAVVKGYRRPTSKLRPHLSLFAQTKVGLVRGKETWRLIFCESTGLVERVIKARPKRIVVGKILAVIRRLIKGEYPHPEIFQELLESIESLAPVSPEDREVLEQIELIRVFRTLHHLGYAPDLPELRPFIQNKSLPGVVGLAPEIRRLMVETINSSLQATHL